MPIDALCFAILAHHLLALGDILFLKFAAEPLVDFILCLGTFDNIKPVPARSLRVLRSQNLDTVPVLNHIINIHKLAVYLGADHFIANSRMNTVCKINRARSIRQIFHFPSRRKAKNRVGKQIQIAF